MDENQNEVKTESSIHDVDVCADTLKKCAGERDEYLSGWKRAKADLINFQKDETKRFDDFIKFSNKAMVEELIAVLDSFDLAIAALGERADKGVYMIRAQLEEVMKRQGLLRMSVTIGSAVDPSLHEAVVAVPSTDYPEGVIIEEIERGYLMHGKVLRPARVKIAAHREVEQAQHDTIV